MGSAMRRWHRECAARMESELWEFLYMHDVLPDVYERSWQEETGLKWEATFTYPEDPDAPVRTREWHDARKTR